MKNDQTNNQDNKQDQGKTANNQYDSNQQKNKNEHTPDASQKSNISVDNDGKIKQDDKWVTGTQEGQTEKTAFQNQSGDGTQQQNNNSNRQDNHLKSDKTVTEPEIETPISDPEKTEKKIPQMESIKNSK